MDDCVFCKIVKKEVPVEAKFEDDEILAFPSNQPEAPIHIIIIPRRHIRDISTLKNSDAELLGKMILVGQKLAEENKIVESGYRLVFNVGPHAGQSVYHLHLHLLGGKPLAHSG